MKRLLTLAFALGIFGTAMAQQGSRGNDDHNKDNRYDNQRQDDKRNDKFDKNNTYQMGGNRNDNRGFDNHNDGRNNNDRGRDNRYDDKRNQPFDNRGGGRPMQPQPQRQNNTVAAVVGGAVLGGLIVFAATR